MAPHERGQTPDFLPSPTGERAHDTLEACSADYEVLLGKQQQCARQKKELREIIEVMKEERGRILEEKGELELSVLALESENGLLRKEKGKWEEEREETESGVDGLQEEIKVLRETIDGLREETDGLKNEAAERREKLRENCY
jgi:chromosome segregation ATPase